jgi:hypothetical protein
LLYTAKHTWTHFGKLQECPNPGLEFRIVRSCVQEDADAPRLLTLLRSRSERPSRRTPKYAEKLPPPHPPPPAQDRHRSGSHTSIEDLGDVRFGSLAGIAAANRDIRFSSAKADIGPSLIL